MTLNTFTVPKLSREPVKAKAASLSTVPKPQQQKSKKRARLPTLVAPDYEDQSCKKQTAAQIA